jgi:hypothetical protein
MPQSGDLVIDNKPYMLVRSGGTSGARTWQEQGPGTAEVNEPGRDVARGDFGQEVRIVWKTKHKGFGEPLKQVDGRDYFGRNVDKRYPNQGILGREIVFLDAPEAAGADPRQIVEFDGDIYMAYGAIVIKVVPGTDTVSTAFDVDATVGAGKKATGLEVFKDRMYLAVGEADAFRHSSDGATWTAHASGSSYSATHFKAAENRLYRVWKGTGTSVPAYLTNNSEDPTSALNWAAQDPIGDINIPVTGMASTAYQIFIAKEDGLYAADIETGRFPSLTPELSAWRNSSNGQGVFCWGGLALMPTTRGEKMYFAGQLFTVGPEVMSANDSEVNGRIVAHAGDANWLFASLYNGTDTYILAARNQRPDDNYPGELVWNTVWYLPGGPWTGMGLTNSGGNPRLWLARDGSATDALAYIKLGSGLDNPLQDSTARYVASGTDYYPAHDGGSPMVDKHFLELRVYCENLSQTAGRKLTWSYRLDDDTAWVELGDCISSPITVLKFSQSQDVVGRRIQLKCEWTRGSTATGTPILRTVEVLAVEFPPTRKLLSTQIWAADNVKLRNGVDSRKGAQIVEDLENLAASKKRVELIDPLGRKRTALALQPVLVKEIIQTDNREAVTIVAANFLILEA